MKALTLIERRVLSSELYYELQGEELIVNDNLVSRGLMTIIGSDNDGEPLFMPTELGYLALRIDKAYCNGI